MWDTNLILDRWWYLSRYPCWTRWGYHQHQNTKLQAPILSPLIVLNRKIKLYLSFNCIESQDQVISVWQLSTSICFAFQWYCGNLTNECSFTYSSSSVKCQFYWNWMLSNFKPRKKKTKKKHKVLPSFAKKVVIKVISLSTMWHFSEFIKRHKCILRRNDP